MLVCQAPLVLSTVGWDASRWIFLALSNFALVAYAWFGADSRPLSTLAIAGMALPFLPLFYQPLAYFDEVTPRPLTPQVVVQHLRPEIPDGFLALPRA